MPDNKLVPWSEVRLSKKEWRDILKRAAESTDDVPWDWWVDKEGVKDAG